MRAKHIILTLGRSGSNTLVDMLNQNPGILNFGEVLGEWNRIRKLQLRLGYYRDDDRAYLDAILENAFIHRTANTYRNLTKVRSGNWRDAKRLRSVKSFGFKEFVTNFHRCGLENYPIDSREAKIIGLTRANVLERMVSNEFLTATGVVSSKSPQGDRKAKLWIDPVTVIEKLEVIEFENQQLLTLLNRVERNRLFRLDYGDLYSNPDRTVKIVRELYTFLDVPDYKPSVRMTKIVKKNPLDALENGVEIGDAIKETRFLKWLSN